MKDNMTIDKKVGEYLEKARVLDTQNIPAKMNGASFLSEKIKRVIEIAKMLQIEDHNSRKPVEKPFKQSNDKETLTKLIEIAIERGFIIESTDYQHLPDLYLGNIGQGNQPFILLYDHAFAKAIWGDEKLHSSYGCDSVIDSSSGEPRWDGNKKTDNSIDFRIESWRYHLQQAVISEDPIKYYWENK